ncbi:MAG: hypothetical protein ABI559_10275 [Chloroflexota bacterium]
MSKASNRKRNRITLALGAFSMLTFGGMYGMIAHNAALDSTTTAAVAEVTAQEQITALVLTDPMVAPTAVPTAAVTVTTDTTANVAAVVTTAPTAAPTAPPTAAPTAAASTHTTTHTTTKAS